MSSIEEYYIWISIIDSLEDKYYKMLLEKFNSLKFLYKISKTSFLFQKYLEDFNLSIPSKLYSQLVSFKIKEKSHSIYKNLKKHNINIKILQNNIILKKPLVLFIKGNVDILEEKKIIYLLRNSVSKSSVEKMHVNFSERLIKNYYYEIELENKIKNYYKNKIIIVNFMIDDLFLINLNNIETDNSIIVFSCKNMFLNNCQDYNIFLTSILTQKVIILESEYNGRNVNFIDNVLDQGKDIYVVPGNIYEKSNYFSNYLIKCGAEVVISINDLDYI